MNMLFRLGSGRNCNDRITNSRGNDRIILQEANMNTLSKSILGKSLVVLLATSFLATPVLSATQAEAGHKKYYKKHYDQHVVVKKKKHHKNNDGDLLAAGIIGLALGAIIVNQARQPNVVYVQPNPVYVQPRQVYVQPQPTYDPYVQRRPLDHTYYGDDVYDDDDGPRVIRYEDSVQATYEPWSAQWSSWCRSNYRSFNPSTGTYRGYDGLDHFCVVK
jgi:hypothetical protein